MIAPILDERFQCTAADSRLEWLNPPKRWSIDPQRGLAVEPHGQTDFWQRTHYGFAADNGHFLGLELPHDVQLSTQVQVHPLHQYDQAGLMIRADATCWLKASVEHEPEGRPQLGVVVTNAAFSDWSLQDFPFPVNAFRLRLSKHGRNVLVEFAPVEGEQWKLMRVARLHCPESAKLRGGLYACSPKSAGFRAEFAFLRVEPLPPADD
jgi:uncharacterized protein